MLKKTHSHWLRVIAHLQQTGRGGGEGVKEPMRQARLTLQSRSVIVPEFVFHSTAMFDERTVAFYCRRCLLPVCTGIVCPSTSSSERRGPHLGGQTGQLALHRGQGVHTVPPQSAQDVHVLLGGQEAAHLASHGGGCGPRQPIHIQLLHWNGAIESEAIRFDACHYAVPIWKKGWVVNVLHMNHEIQARHNLCSSSERKQNYCKHGGARQRTYDGHGYGPAWPPIAENHH